MILDSSAAVAVILDEPAADAIVDALGEEGHHGIGAPTLAETGIVLATRVGPAARTQLRAFLTQVEVEEIPFRIEHWPVAVDAFLRYGRGRHPARLNFGDCLAYAVARLADEPLLCVGDDFAQTDLAVVRP